MNVIIKPRNYFTQVSNHILINKEISLKAKGVYCYLISKPDNYEFSADRIANECKEGRKAILTAVSELENAGYLHRVKLSNGKVNYYFFNFPSEKAKFLKGTVPKSHSGTLEPINNKDSLNNTNLINKDKKKKIKFNAHEYIQELLDQNKINTDIADNLFDWLDLRKAKRVATTKKAIDLNLKFLEKVGKPVLVIQQSIRNGWTGLFELKECKTEFKPTKGRNQLQNKQIYTNLPF